MNGAGVLDESGRLRLLGSGVTGAAFAVVLVMLVLSSWTEATTTVLVSVGIPSAAAGAAIAVYLQLRSWRAEGGYENSVLVRDWVAEGQIPVGVPADLWIPLVQAQADREGAGWGKVVLGTLWIAMTWSMRDQHDALITTMLILLWAGMVLWAAVWVIPVLERPVRCSAAASPRSAERPRGTIG
ncbi:hypothetical protein QP157_15525 [Sphingomonas sp. LR61]|uniref:hypothetical protein n=1 Tax=Sphingomonas sp. LR61 TaxID=3050234 RepID=UPI002FE2AFC3